MGFARPQIFAEPEKAEVQRYPSDMSVFKIRRDYIGEAWIDVLQTVMRFGTTVSGMYGGAREVQNLCVVVEKEDPKRPKIPDYMQFKRNGLTKYVKGFFDTDLRGQAYTYGERIFSWDGVDQGKMMIEKLTRSPYDRGALAVLWKPHFDNFPPKDTAIKEGGQTKGWKVPCLVMILGQCIDDDFNLTAIFRNNDMFGAWPLNAFALRDFQAKIAKKIGKDLGSLTTISHIAEIYETDWNDSVKVVAKNNNLARTCQYDGRGYYTVAVEGKNIVLTFFSPDGTTELAKFTESGKKKKVARDMCAAAIKEMLISDLGAACDLGRQLAKAEAAVKLGLSFTQDQELGTE